MKARKNLGAATVAALVLLVVAPAFAAEEASVGKVSVLEGTATRRSGGSESPLAVGSPIRLNDTIVVAERSRLKMTLNDESVIMLDERSELTLTEADFENQVRKSFAARLGIGKFWAKVKKAVSGSDAKFEVTTDRAVAGVRGTIFRVDAVTLVKASTRSAPAKATRVRVTKGKVAVESRFNKDEVAKAAVKPSRGKRVQVQGPQEITREQWEEKFVELQKGWSVTVGDAGYWQVEPKSAEPQDAFAKFIQANDDGKDE